MDVINSLFAREFPVNTTHVYLNHAAVAPWPVRASQAVGRFAEENSQIGASHYLQWLDVKNTLRQQLATLCHAHIDEIAFVKNTSEALSFVAAGIDWQAGDVVLISDEEFPSNRIVWEALADQGVIVRKVSLQGDDPNAALERELSNGIKLLAISAVQYGSGIAVDLVRLGRICKQHNVLFCVDAIQVIGAMPFDVNEIQCDFAMADGHKWMLG
ncbi:MAG: aminotransferase class V-fold PLP-dependent enzyme, partial [Oleibacter sp.]|nr:aminotransferase class V-fold PLP-dependent enzyme [Thalassolituus sp.]